LGKSIQTTTNINAELKGNTLKVYVYVLKNGDVGVRQVQRALRLSNPSLAQYHLNKLKDMGLVKEEGGTYEICAEVKVDALRGLLRIGTFLVPRFVFYAVLFTLLGTYFIVASIPYVQGYPLIILFYGLVIFASAAFWFESFHAWKSAP
jgi:hypothetical protein